MLLNRHYYELSSRGFWVAEAQYDSRGLGEIGSYWRCVWFILNSASQRPGVMNMTLAPSERRTDSRAVKQALKSETVVGSRERRGKGGGMKTLLASSATGIHQCLSRQLSWLGNELVSSVCVLKQARGTLILPNQGLCWHIPSVVSLLLFHPLLETERQSWRRQGRQAWLAPLLRAVSFEISRTSLVLWKVFDSYETSQAMMILYTCHNVVKFS